MKDRNGSAAIILFIVLALAVIGGIAYVHYVYLPQMAAQNNVPAGSASTTPSAATTTPTPTQTASGNCADNDLSCLIAAAQNCSAANTEWTQTINLFGLFNQTSQVHLALNGLNSAGKCSFSERTDNLSLSLTSSTTQAAEAKGLTQAQIQSQLQAAQAQAKQQSVGITLSCAIPTNTLVQILTRWSNGNFSSSDLASGNCTAALPNGTKTQLDTGGPIQLTPSQPQAPANNSSDNGASQTATAPSGVGTVTAYLYSNEDSTLNGVEFKVNGLTATQLNVTVTDHSTGQTQTVILTPNNPMIVAGHDMMVTSIQSVSNGTVNGQPTYNEEATLSYK